MIITLQLFSKCICFNWVIFRSVCCTGTRGVSWYQVRQVERTQSVNFNAGNIFIESSAEIFKCFPNRPSVSWKMYLSGESQRETKVVVRALILICYFFQTLNTSWMLSSLCPGDPQPQGQSTGVRWWSKPSLLLLPNKIHPIWNLFLKGKEVDLRFKPRCEGVPEGRE